MQRGREIGLDRDHHRRHCSGRGCGRLCKTTAVLKERLDALRKDVEVLSRRVDKHNGVQERVLLAECKIEELEKELKK